MDSMDNGILGGSIFGFVVLIMDLIGIFEVIESRRTLMSKVGWSVFIFAFPVLGAVIYYLLSNRNEYRHSEYGPLLGNANNV